jgi:hypothetical protein
MKLLSIGQGIAAAAVLFAATAGVTSQPSDAATTCVVSLVKYLKDACPPGLTYTASSAPAPSEEAEPTITPTASTAPCVKSLVTYLVNRCPG